VRKFLKSHGFSQNLATLLKYNSQFLPLQVGSIIDMHRVYSLSRYDGPETEQISLYYVSVRVYVNLKNTLINNSRGKYKRNECLINVCKSDKDLS
jgi:hypothetical protein